LDAEVISGGIITPRPDFECCHLLRWSDGKYHIQKKQRDETYTEDCSHLLLKAFQVKDDVDGFRLDEKA
jgi:hypothetical protein